MMNPEVKLVFLGDTQAGKTTIISAFSQPDVPVAHPTATVGASLTTQLVAVDGVEVRLKIWDTAGQERFRALAPMYYRDAHVAVLVFAVDVPESLAKLRSWLGALRKDAKTSPAILIVGNKIDLPRKVLCDEGEAFAQVAEATYFECSATLKKGVTELFHLATALAVGAKWKNQTHIPMVVEVKAVKKKQIKCCS
jgi:Ras-related protein Rab-5C